MKRLIGLVLVAAAVVGAALLPEPEALPGPDFVGPEIRESVAAASASVWVRSEALDQDPLRRRRTAYISVSPRWLPSASSLSSPRSQLWVSP